MNQRRLAAHFFSLCDPLRCGRDRFPQFFDGSYPLPPSHCIHPGWGLQVRTDDEIGQCMWAATVHPIRHSGSRCASSTTMQDRHYFSEHTFESAPLHPSSLFRRLKLLSARQSPNDAQTRIRTGDLSVHSPSSYRYTTEAVQLRRSIGK